MLAHLSNALSSDGNIGARHLTYCEQQIALQAATEANHPLLQATVWGWTSFTWTYAQAYPAALRCIQQAHSLATQSRVVYPTGCATSW